MLRRCGFWIQIANELIVVIMNTTFTVCTIVDLIYLSNIRIDDLINRVEILEQPEKITFSDIIRVIND